MEMQFRDTVCPCLQPCLRQVQNSEGTLELRLPDGMPDIGRILMSWGQPILRGKEWRGDNVAMTGGMMVWVLYAPEDGSQVRCLEGWIPFQLRWELPAGTRDGQLRVELATRFVDGRTVSARKIMVRAGLAALAEGWIPADIRLYSPGEAVEAELKQERYPLRLVKEAGERSFLLPEELSLSAAAPQPEKILSCSLRPEITEKKVMANKAVFRGNGNLHLVYLSEEGNLVTWDFPLSFSQLAELEDSYSADALLRLSLCATTLEPELDEEGSLRLKCALTAQYVVEDSQIVEVVTDAYSPTRQLDIRQETLRLPVLLDSRVLPVYEEETIPTGGGQLVELSLLRDFPGARFDGESYQLEAPGALQALYYDPEGNLQSALTRFESQMTLAGSGEATLCARPLSGGEPQILMSPEGANVRWELPVEVTASGYTEIPMVTGLELGEPRKPELGSPSLLLRRAGTNGLWDIAKSTGSTVEAIRKANALQEDPAPGQLLLIPMTR